MKNHPITSLLLTAALVCPAVAEETTIAFSNPDAPGVFRALLSNGEISIVGDDEVDQVVVESDLESTDNGESRRRSDGLRVIGRSTSFDLHEADNVVTLVFGHDGWPSHGEFRVRVPRDTAIELEMSLGGEIDISDIDGDVSIKNLNGEVELANLGGGAIVESMNGEIEASFRRLVEDRPLSFTSMNGEIELNIPEDAKANVRFRTQNGTILTDFDENVMVTKTTSGRAFAPDLNEELAAVASDIANEAVEVAVEIANEVRVAVAEARGQRRGSADDYVPDAPHAPRAPRAPRVPIPPMAGGKVIAGTLNGGGTALQVATMNGDIIIRKQVAEDDED